MMQKSMKGVWSGALLSAALLSGPLGAEEARAMRSSASAGSSLAEETFSLRLEHSGSVSVGKESRAKLVLEAKAGFKVNDQYPIKFQLEESSSLGLSGTVLRRESFSVEKTKASVEVPFTAKQSGEHRLSGRLSFSVCTEERCLIEKRDLSLNIKAQ